MILPTTIYDTHPSFHRCRPLHPTHPPIHPSIHPSVRPYRRRVQTDRKTDGQADGGDRHKDGQRHSHQRAHRYRPTFINPIRPYMRILYTHHITAHYTQYTALSQLTICHINTNSYYITLPYSTPPHIPFHYITSYHFTSLHIASMTTRIVYSILHMT